MIVKRVIATAIAICLGAGLGSCSSFSGYVSDHWPQWAGGMPDDVPPRLGEPGYQEFISHGQADATAAKTAAGVPQAAPVFAKTGAQSVSVQPTPSVAPAGNDAEDDPSTVRGGLY
jgi:hypothetical protein